MPGKPTRPTVATPHNETATPGQRVTVQSLKRYVDTAYIAHTTLACKIQGKTMTEQNRWPAQAFTVQNGTDSPTTIVIQGRARWALEALMRAGTQGCTPIDTPGPRWSAYVFKLRKQGVCIETVHETHEGPFPGNHARYVLRSNVTLGRRAA